MSVSDVLAADIVEQANPEPDDASLVVLARVDRTAFTALYARYANLIYRYCYRRLRESEAAADATSQIFVKAITGVHSCQPEKFRSWLFAIAHNVTIDLLRAGNQTFWFDDAPEPIDDQPGPEEIVVRSDEGARLRAVILQLPPDQRRILELRLSGLTTVEIAETLGRSRGSVDTAQCRAIQRLRTLMNADQSIKKATANEPR